MATRKPTATPAAKPAAKRTKEAKTSARKLTALQRAAVAVRLKKEGKTFEEIGKDLSITRQAAHQLVKKYMEESRELILDDAADLLQFQLERLDFLYGATLAGVRAGEPKSINAAHQILMSQAKLQGLITDKAEVETNVVAGVFALPMGGTTNDEWSAKALELAAGEEAKAEELLKGKKDDGGANEAAAN